MRLELTEEGWAFMPRLIEAHQDLNALVNVGIGEEEKRVFLDVMKKIHQEPADGPARDSGKTAAEEARNGAEASRG